MGMSDNWPGEWISGAEKLAASKEVGFTNDNGILCLTGETGEEYLFMEDAPEAMGNHC